MITKGRLLQSGRAAFRSSDIPDGAILRREWHGETHEIFVTSTTPPEASTSAAKKRAKARKWWRYVYRGKHYKSLSAVATQIVGSRISGNHFFGFR